jgi:hypothetical protein
LEAALSLLDNGFCAQRPSVDDLVVPALDIELARQQLERLRPPEMPNMQ